MYMYRGFNISMYKNDSGYYGNLEGIADSVTFRADTLIGLEVAFHKAVDAYIKIKSDKYKKEKGIGKLEVGAKLWFIRDFDEIMDKPCFRKWLYRAPLKVPYETRVSQVVEMKDRVLYQLRGRGHMPESFIGIYCFLSKKEEAFSKLRSQRCYS